ncbi:MAG: hypothetical protein JWL87_67 [Candidatus Adlerbacteria bacterium]|nr:hypothetical protein [Candidatus Adlerbacteria bacterium]
MKRLLVLVAAALLILPAGQAFAAAYKDTSTPAILHKAYKDAQKGKGDFKVLIVAGHDDQFSGTSFAGLREADLNLELAEKIKDLLGDNKNLEVRMARTEEGYDPDLLEYFTDRREQTEDFIARYKDRMERHLESGNLESASGVPHGTAASEAALRLYGINKWSNDEEFDLVLHVHFNDTARYDLNYPAPYTGFTIYTPENQFGNARGSWAVGEALRDRLMDVTYPSTLPGESAGLVEDQELIAIGAYNTLEAASVLVEYSYIYERRIQDPLLRESTLNAMAEATQLGLEDFFKDK